MTTMPSNASVQEVKFEHKRKMYKTDRYAFATGLVVLPDKTVLSLVSWDPLGEPQITSTMEIEHRLMHLTQDQIAQQFGAATANAY